MSYRRQSPRVTDDAEGGHGYRPGMLLDRYHGLGNDYLVLVDGPPLDATKVVALCDRHTGPGGDGLLEPQPAHEGAHGLRIWNPDGSVAEKSGNGLRIFAQWLVDQGLAAGSFDLWTGFCRVGCTVGPHDVVVAMGRGTLVPSEVPVQADQPVINEVFAGVDAPGVTAVGMGNPHAVVWVDEAPEGLPWRSWGAALEVHPRFPNRTNVQIAQVTGPAEVAIRIWERGAGATLASGSSACGVVVSAVATGRLAPGSVAVVMEGGTAEVTVSAELDVVLRAPVERIGRVVVDPGWLDRRGWVTP